MIDSDAASDIPSVLRVLKAMLRARGLHYADLATALGKSESSLKRYLSGRRLTLSGLEDICRLFGVSLAEFCEIAAKELSNKPDTLTPEQERELAADPELMLVLVLILQRRTSAEIVQDLAIDETRLFPLLMRLERLNLLKVYPGNRVRLLISEKLNVPPGSPIRDGFVQVMKDDFMRQDWVSASSHWSVQMARLSDASVAQLDMLIINFNMQLHAMADRDRREGLDARWYCVLSSGIETDLPDYIRRVREVQAREQDKTSAAEPEMPPEGSA